MCSLPLLKVTCLLPGVQWKLLQRKLHSLLLFRHHSFLLNCCACALIPKELNPSVALHSPWQEDGWCSHQVLPNRSTTHTMCPMTAMGPRTHPALQGALGLCCQQLLSKKPCVHANTVQNKIEFVFKIKLLYRVIYTLRTPQGKKLWGVSVMKDIIHLCLNRKA